MKNKISFIIKVMAIHTLTYILSGIIFKSVFDYDTLFQLDGVRTYMKNLNTNAVAIGPIIQILRGILLGLVLLPFRTVIYSKLGWFYLWSLLIIVGVISPYGAAPGTIEGVVYTTIPLKFHLTMLPEIIVQTLVFSILVAGKFQISNKFTRPIITTVIVWVGVSVTGVVLALVQNVNIQDAAGDIGAFLILFVSLGAIYLLSNLYYKSKLKGYLYYSISYLLLASLPTIYNYIVDSPLKSPLSIITALFPIVIVYVYDKLLRNHKEKHDTSAL